jgi:CheY-like chemotaxis protein
LISFFSQYRLAVSSSLEEMKEQISSCFDLRSNSNNPVSRMKHIPTMFSKLEDVKNSLSSLTGNYHLLQSVINNYSDSIKMINDVPLTPTIEEVRLLDLIEMITGAMKGISSFSEIDMNYDEKISIAILTDIQWLQDNLICCLSSAVECDSVTSIVQSERNVKFRAFLISLSTEISPFPMMNNVSTNNMIRFEIESYVISRIFCEETEEKENDNDEYHIRNHHDLAFSCLVQRVIALKGQYGIEIRKGSEDLLFWFSIPYIPSSHVVETTTISTFPVSGDCTSCYDPPPVPLHRMKLTDVSLSTVSSTSSVSIPSLSTKPDVNELPSSSVETLLSNYDRFSSLIRHSHSVASIPVLLAPHRSSSRSAKQHVVVVDDSLSFSKAVKRTLEKVNFHVTIMHSCKEVLELFQQIYEEEKKLETPLLYAILINLEVSSMNSFKLIRKIRGMEKVGLNKGIENEAVNDIMRNEFHEETSIGSQEEKKREDKSRFMNNNHLIIALSSSTDNETVNKAFLCGVNDFLPKPFKLQVFQQILFEFYSKKKNRLLIK